MTRTFLLIVMIAGLAMASLQARAQSNEYTFGIVPQQSASKLAKLWGPILAEVSKRSGIRLRFATAKDIPTFEARLAAGEYDFAYMNPYHYTTFSETSGYRALAKAKNKRIKGILVVRKDSNINDLRELEKTTLAFPAPAAFAASILTQAELNRLGIDHSAKYVSSHDSVYRAVAKGLYPAGGGVIRTFKNVAPEVREQLRILWTSKGYTPHAIASSSRVDNQVVNKLQTVLSTLADDKVGKQLLNSIRLKGLETAQHADWDDVRALSINRIKLH